MKKLDFLNLSTLILPPIDKEWNNKQNVYITDEPIEKRKGDKLIVKHIQDGKYIADMCIVEEIRHLRLDEISPDIWKSNLWVGKNTLLNDSAVSELFKIRFNGYTKDDKLEVILLKPVKLI